jgi:hypothetical protein
VLPVDYLSRMEELLRQVVNAASTEGTFDLHSPDEGKKSPLQRAIGRAAGQLLYWHYSGDGCVDHDGPPDPGELRRRLLAAIDEIDTQVFRRNWGYETPSPGKLIREGLRIAEHAIKEVPLTAPSYLDAVLQALKAARDRQDASGISDDGWRDEDGYILAGIADAVREVEKLRTR